MLCLNPTVSSGYFEFILYACAHSIPYQCQNSVCFQFWDLFFYLTNDKIAVFVFNITLKYMQHGKSTCMWHMCMLTIACCKILGFQKINLSWTRYKVFLRRIDTVPGSEQYLDWSWSAQVGSVLVWSKCSDKQLCFAPNPWIGPGLEQTYHIKQNIRCNS